MTRFWAFLFLTAIAATSAVRADEIMCGNDDQGTSFPTAERDIYRSLMRISESVDPRKENAFIDAARKPMLSASQRSYPVQRTSAEIPIKVRRDSLVIRAPATSSDGKSLTSTLSFREPAATQDFGKSSVKRVGFDREDTSDKLDEATSDSSLDFLDIHIADPPGSFGGTDANRAETEATLDLLRQELRREAEQKQPLQTLPRQTNSPQPPQPEPQPPHQQPLDEPRLPIDAKPLFPVLPHQTNIIPDVNRPSNLSADTFDDQDNNQDDGEIEVENPPQPGTDRERQPRMDTLNPTDWILNVPRYDTTYPDASEAVFCEEMWVRAGGRRRSRFHRVMHNLRRNFDVVAVGRCGRCGIYGRGAYIPWTRSLCGPAIGSYCHVGVGRTQRGRNVTNQSVGCMSGCASPDTCTGCTSQSDCVTATGCSTGACGGCPRCIGQHLCRGCRSAVDREPWTVWGILYGDVETGINVSGWTSIGYHSRANGLFNDHPHGFKPHQAWVAFERVADTTCQDFAWGVRADVMYGLDAQNTQAFGSHPSSYDYLNGLDHGDYGWAIPQLYGELAFGETSVIIGHFYTLMGYEVVPAPDNFFFSHSITMVNSEPFTHTGVLATTAASEYLEWYYGWTLGWDTGFDQLNNGNSFLGGFKWKLTDVLSASYVTSAGDFGSRGSGYAQSLVFAANVSENWGYVLQSDLLRVHGEDNVGVNQYLFYHLNDCVSLGSRFEWWKGDNVTGYAPFGAVLPAGGSHSYYEATVGANFHVGKNVVLRPEGRYDWSPAVNFSVGTGAVDVVFTF